MLCKMSRAKNAPAYAMFAIALCLSACAGGGALGAVAGAIGGDPLLGAGVGVLAGLVGGGGYAEATTENHEERVVKNCMHARGYTILG